MSWGTSILVILFLGGMFFLRSAPELSESAKPFVGPGMAAIVLFTLVQFVGNQFGLDRDGFRALVLAPSDRRLLLLGKNLAVVPVALVFGLLIVLGASLWLAMPWMVVLASVFQFVVMLMLLMVLGNLMSILVPYRIEPGTMKPSKLPMLAMLGLMVAYMLFPLMMLPAFLPPLAAITWAALEWPSWVPVNLLLSLGLMIAVASGYWWSLTPLGELFARREHAILRRVTAGME